MKFECYECGSKKELHHHHVVPRMRGGTKTIPLCPSCHAKVHGRDSMHTGTLIKEKLAQKKKQGYKLGSAPYGYKFNEQRKGFIEDEKEQKIIQIVKDFGSRHKPYGRYKKLAEELNNLGITSRYGGQWNKQTCSTRFRKYFKEDK